MFDRDRRRASSRGRGRCAGGRAPGAGFRSGGGHGPALLVGAIVAVLAGCPAPPAPEPERRQSVRPPAAAGRVSPAAWPAASPTPGRASEPLVLRSREPNAGVDTGGASPTPGPCEAFGRVDSLAIAGPITRPAGVAVDAEGHVWVSLYDTHEVVELVPAGGCDWRIARRVGGSAGELNDPRGLAFDPGGRWLYVADYANHRVRRIDTLSDAPTVESYAGAGIGGFRDGPAAEAWFWHPADVAVDRAGAVYVADSYNHRIRKIAAGAGGAAGVSTVMGEEEGAAPGRFNKPAGIEIELAPLPAGFSPPPTPIPGAIDAVPEELPILFVADTLNDRLVRLGPPAPAGPSPTTAAPASPTPTPPVLVRGPDGTAWEVTVIAGRAGEKGLVDGPAGESRLSGPTGLFYDRGALWIADTGNHVIRRIGSARAPVPRTMTFAGGGFGVASDDGPLLEARFRFPQALARSVRGELYVADTDADRVRIARGNQEAP